MAGEKVFTVFDPPVTPFSRPETISAWIEELRGRAGRPEFQHAENRKRLDAAIAEAQEWLARSQTRAASRLRRPPDRPAV
ncbi:MAG TPA: hypothetical protein VF092_29135 [Longimicrobium sp.]